MAKMGRPPKKKRDKQSALVMLRFTPEEARRVDKAARASGMKRAVFLRHLVLREV